MATPLHPPEFGIVLQTGIRAGSDPVEEAREAEQLGFDAVTLHRDTPHSADPLYEMWTLLTWLAAHTARVRLAPMLLALPNRHPALLAKMADTLDRLSGGRLVLTLGAGGEINEPGYRAFGLTQRSPREKVEALEEAIDIVRGLWSTSGLTYRGRHFSTDGANIEPRPARPVPIWLGAFGDRMLDLVGRKADGWLPTYHFLEPERAYRGLEIVRKVAQDAGRDPESITYGYSIPVLVEEGRTSTRGQVAGNPERVAAQLADFARHGFTFLNLWPGPAGDSSHQRERLAREVLPLVRDLASAPLR